MATFRDPEDTARASRVRELMDDYLRNRTPQERDRLMQIHLAEARGPAMNAWLLSESMDWALTRKSRRNAAGI
jgi:hypothetical protein